MGMYFSSSTGISFHFKQVKEDFMFHFEMQIFIWIGRFSTSSRESLNWLDCIANIFVAFSLIVITAEGLVRMLDFLLKYDFHPLKITWTSSVLIYSYFACFKDKVILIIRENNMNSIKYMLFWYLLFA